MSTSETTTNVPQWLGTASVVLPGDMFNLMAPAGPAEARAKFAEMFTEMFPHGTQEQRAVLTEGLLAWREMLFEHGFLTHAIVSVPVPEDGGGPAHWQVLVGGVEVPTHGQIDVGAVLGQSLAVDLAHPDTYVEHFTTDHGWGVGVVTRIAAAGVGAAERGTHPPPPEEAQSDDDAGRTAETPAPGYAAARDELGNAFDGLSRSFGDLPGAGSELGLTATLTADHGAPYGLLVLGFCLDTERLLDLAAVVGVIAHESRLDLTPTDDAPDPVRPDSVLRR